MGKVNKNIKAKAKLAVAKAAASIHRKSEPEDKNKLLLHKTITPKKSITKREKFRQKHKKLMGKFALIKKKRKEEIARKNREKTAVIGDLKPLMDALPSLDELYRLSKLNKDVKTGIKEFDEPSSSTGTKSEDQKKPSAKQKLKQKQAKFISQVKSFEALLKDPDFKKNPRDVVAYHIKYTHGALD